MQAINRRLERRMDIIEDLKTNFQVEQIIDLTHFEKEGKYLEGTGSMVLDRRYKIAYACLSPRTHSEVLDAFVEATGYKVVKFNATDAAGKDVYHTNVIMHLGDGYAVICMESIPDETERIAVSQLLISTGHEIIPITFEQVRKYAGNMLQVQNATGKKFTVLSRSAYVSLTGEQKKIFNYHTNLLPIDINTIETVGGGSVRCMMAEIFLEKK